MGIRRERERERVHASLTICPGEALGKPFDALETPLEIALRRKKKKKTGECAEIGASEA